MTKQLDIFDVAAGCAVPQGDNQAGAMGAESRPAQHHGGAISWPTFERYKTDYDRDRPPFGVAEGWDHMVHVIRQRDAQKRKARP